MDFGGCIFNIHIRGVSLRINPINIYTNNYVSSKKQTKSTTTNKNTELSNFAYRPIFRATDFVKKACEAPLADKLAVAFSKIKPNDYILVSNDLNKEKSKIFDYFTNISAPIRKLLFLKDKSLKNENLFFGCSFDAQTGITKPYLQNIDKTPKMVNMFDLVPPNYIKALDYDDRIIIGRKCLEIKESYDTDFNLEDYSSSFIKEYDFSDSLKNTLIKHNKNVFTEIFDKKEVPQKSKLSFASVGGQDENIKILKRNVLYPLKYPEVFNNFMLNRGVILAGPPGTGKTLLAKALAAESGASSFELCATDLAAKYVGESEKNCRKLFQDAVDAQPSIIYFDEFDALAKSRGSSDVHGDKLLNQLLSLMSDLEKRKDNVFVIASTNRKDSLDAAILRSGRFGLQLEVNAPDLEGTKQILAIHTKDKPLDKDLKPDEIAQKMFDKKMTGVEIADVVKRAYSNALERCDIYKSMEENRFSPQMLDFLSINKEDFNKAIEEFKNSTKQRRPIGFGVSL